jgi:uncharacterized protein
MKRFAIAHPVTAYCIVSIGIFVPLCFTLLIAGQNVFGAKLLGLILYVVASTVITGWIGGGPAVRDLFRGLIKWRIGAGRWLLVLAAMPVLTLAVAAATGTLHAPEKGWLPVLGLYLLFLAYGGLTANLWEELGWAGFVQARLMSRRGLLAGSLLTAVPFGLIHLPLAFETDGWAGTTWHEALVNLAFLLGALPFLRYVVGVLLVDTRGSILAVAVLHASFNAAGAMPVIPAGWQQVPGLVILASLVVAHRIWRGRSLVHGDTSGNAAPGQRYAPELVDPRSTDGASAPSPSPRTTPAAR